MKLKRKTDLKKKYIKINSMYSKLKSNKKINAPISKLKKHRIQTPVTTQQVVNCLFKEYDVESGLLKINDEVYSIELEYTDVSFSKAKLEEQFNIFNKWIEYLHSFNERVHIEVVNSSKPIKTEIYKNEFLYETDNKHSKLINDLNASIKHVMLNKTEVLETRRTIVISKKYDSLEDARADVLDIQLKTEEKFKELKSRIRVVPVQERLEAIYNFFHQEATYGVDYIELAKKQNKTIYDVLAPKSISFKHRNVFQIDEQFGSILYVEKLPTSITPKFYNKLITNSELNLITTLNITPTNSNKVIKMLNKKILGMKTERLNKVKRALKAGYNYELVADEKLESAIVDAKQLLYDIQKNGQNIFNNNFMICVLSNSIEQLTKDISKVIDIAGENLIRVRQLSWQQLEGIQHVLPLGHNTIQLQRTLTSEATAANVPFNSRDLQHKNSIYYGMNLLNKKALFVDRKKLLNGNGAILATSGSGKSFMAKLTAIEQPYLRYPDDDIIILDLNGEYGKVVAEFRGQTIEMSLNSGTYINPLDMNLNLTYDDTDALSAKCEYMIAWITSLVADMTSSKQSIIDRCVKILFTDARYPGKPLLKDLYNCFKAQPEKEAQDLALDLERYVLGSIHMFAHETNVDINNRLVSFDFSKLPESLQTTSYLTVLEHIMNRLARNREVGRYTWIVIDEFHILLSNEYSADYICRIYKIGRKYFAIPTIITQNIDEVVDNKYGRKILANSEFAIILKQKKLELQKLCGIFGISSDESEYVQGSAAGQGLLVYGEDIVPFKNTYPTDSYVYHLNHTSNQEITRG